MRVTDMTHFDGIADLDPEENRPLFRLVDHLGSMVKAGCVAPPGETVASAIRCNRRPKGRSCPGYIEIHRVDVPPQLRWQCSWCEDAGVTYGFEGTVWDITPRGGPSTSDGESITVTLSPAEFEAVRRIQALDPDDERIVYAARHARGLIQVSGPADGLASLAGMIADEAGDEANARRRADLNAAFDRIEFLIGDEPEPV
jgi:hypothetical protein